ncbi:hypothetical protein CLV63_11952 [Murinocardiopsis flavida]|uniref:Uncharacterized protein n=1 Tax=Murinocardiopsis flavida TaxID=645275 RepID=A0A2P8D3H6_9ACTN|nr:hypothetical protein [Murinocardiopsis flavida]PSK91771.1 hypothetical protein CLV63_11952 [Murinocardiopsis flavida]
MTNVVRLHTKSNDLSKEGPSHVPWAARAQVTRVDIIHNGVPSEFTRDMTHIAKGSDFMAADDMAALMGLLDHLRDWLENHGALTPGSRILVRVAGEDIAPAELAAERRNPGRVVDTRWVTTRTSPRAPFRRR